MFLIPASLAVVLRAPLVQRLLLPFMLSVSLASVGWFSPKSVGPAAVFLPSVALSTVERIGAPLPPATCQLPGYADAECQELRVWHRSVAATVARTIPAKESEALELRAGSTSSAPAALARVASVVAWGSARPVRLQMTAAQRSASLRPEVPIAGES